MKKQKTIEFWFDPASTYCYLTAMRIQKIAATKKINVSWEPFLLGPIFKSQNWQTSPFKIYPRKGEYMVRDIQRTAAKLGLNFELPTPFPSYSLHAARIAILGKNEAWVTKFTKSCFVKQFSNGQNIADFEVLGKILEELNLDPKEIIESSKSLKNKNALKENTKKAMDLGIFGAPTFVVGGSELFWGDDRLEQAIEYLGNSP